MKSEVGILIESSGDPVHHLKSFVKEVRKNVGRAPVILLVTKEQDWNSKGLLEADFGMNASVKVVEGQPENGASTYVYGLFELMNRSKRILEIDSGGAFDPDEIPRLLAKFDKKNVGAVLSTRFSGEGGYVGYPKQRQIVSQGATVLSNMFLGTNLTDASSGFEAFTSETLKKVFRAVPPEKWVSVSRGPLHMYQTEMRAIISKLGVPYVEHAITYGKNKKGGALPLSYIFQSLLAFCLVWSELRKIPSSKIKK